MLSPARDERRQARTAGTAKLAAEREKLEAVVEKLEKEKKQHEVTLANLKEANRFYLKQVDENEALRARISVVESR